MTMLQSIKKHSWLILLAGGLLSARAFVPGGPGPGGGTLGDAWQTPVIGYGLAGDILTPKNIAEEYRRNTPVMYYSCNANFSDYFGSNGVAAVDSAYAILNSLTNVSSYSSSLSEFPLYSQQVNYTAQSLFLSDLKSDVLGLMVEQLGLADPVRYVWDLRARQHIPGSIPPCPLDMEYLVVQRNLEIAPTPVNQVQYSPFVNGVLYTYEILEACTPPNPVAETIPFSPDPFSLIYSPVASSATTFIDYGYFYNGLTRDDVAGLRYLYSSTNINFESSAAGSAQLLTNTSPQILVTTLPFTSFAAAAATNSPVQMLALYPGLVIVSSNSYFTNIPTPNIVLTTTPVIGAPAGTVKVVATTNGYTPNFFQYYTYVFGNIYTNTFSANSYVSNLTTSIKVPVGSPIGTPGITNTTGTKSLVHQPTGDFFIIPTAWCGFKIIQTLGFQTIITTNATVAVTNLVSGTNQFASTQFTTTIFTNHTFVIQPSICTAAPDAAVLRKGIENIKYVKVNFDSLIGQLFQPVTNFYSMVTVSNSQPFTRYYQRIITAPDFLFTATDSSAFGGGILGSRSINFNQANALPGLAGPGTIDPGTTITLNKSAPVFLNESLVFLPPLFETNQINLLAWGSFDASTNDPVVYPDGTSIANLENQILVQITPQTLPNGTNNVAYPATTFTATGGSFQPPFTWSLLPSSVLPQGLSLSSGGTISGTPVNNPPGTYDFVVQLTDSLSRTVNWSYSINIPQ
jgi:Putative Ig domain